MLLLYLAWVLAIGANQSTALQDKTIFSGNKGKVHFISNAPLEHIEATSNQLSGGIDVEKRKVYFNLRIVSFTGFNSGLQQEHFNENYMESDVFPKATFEGKIVDAVDLSKNGTYNVRVKGMLSIHGVAMERIISGKIIVNGKTMEVESSFPIKLADHNITIPKIVDMKIAKEVTVDVKIELTRNNS
jgi:polyisoprenoid-binding protein YceI